MPVEVTKSESATDKRISVLETNYEHLSTEQTAIKKAVTDGFADLRNVIRDSVQPVHSRIDRIEQRSQISWPLIVSVLGLILVMCGGLVSFVTMTTNPIKARTDENSSAVREHIKWSLDLAYQRGRNEAINDSQQELIMDLKNRVHDVEQRCAAGQQALNSIERWLEQVDRRGSGRWVGDQGKTGE